MGTKKFAAATLNLEHETFVIHVVSFLAISLSFNLLDANIHSSFRSQISSLITKEAPIKVFTKYSNFADVFTLDLAFELPKYTRINDHNIELVNGQQLPYESIYSLEPVELETLKAYIKINLVNGFIKPSMSPASAQIFFDQKSNGFLLLCVDYQDFNNLIIKNRYLLPLIGELLDRLRRARQFT